MNFKKILFLTSTIFFIYSCKTTSVVSDVKKESNYETEKSLSENKFIGKKIVNEAKSYLGTPYKYSGTTKSGIDCSGLVYNVFSEMDIKIPRNSSAQGASSKSINLKNIEPGDLLFFGQKQKISHVGIVESIKNNEIFFIHSSTSKGVIISSLNDKYWNPKFIKAGRFK